MSLKRCLILIALIALASPAWAEASNTSSQSVSTIQTTQSSSPNIGWHGWGVRLGVTDGADQVIGGAHFNLGEFSKNLRFQPDVQLGTGDDRTTLYGTAPVYYRFDTSSRLTPYAGGGVALGYAEQDLPPGASGDGNDFGIGVKATGGLEWGGKNRGQAFFVELSLGFGDVHDAQLLGAWTF